MKKRTILYCIFCNKKLDDYDAKTMNRLVVPSAYSICTTCMTDVDCADPFTPENITFFDKYEIK